MKKYIPILLLVFTLISCKNETNNGETDVLTTSKAEKNVKTNSDLLLFPEDYTGIYKGKLNITTSNGLNSIPMELHLLATQDSLKYDYKIFYGEERSERPYSLLKTNNPNLFELDENNGIILPTAYSENTLFSTYEVAGNLLTSTLIFNEEYIEFLISFSPLESKELAGEAEGFEVNAYPITVMQKARLFKE
ncbi:hypothetical protein [Nonlabens tegetincola]|uniref:hypothetical protein n=1 Tax=Nonlabens tegetincola TaxID=323273 RepID=UPI000CF3649D|nr:hypothetical protein [Nonlabens tegetincola]PQJ18600.1 hypothetical protein BST93_08950 [Nonlabens tegetincola]